MGTVDWWLGRSTNVPTWPMGRQIGEWVSTIIFLVASLMPSP